jgi:plasmid stability protein
MSMTIRLDEDVAERLKAEAARSQRSIDELGNEVLREQLHTLAEPPRKPFRVRAREMGTPTIDLSCTSRALAMLDQLDETTTK